MPLDPFLSPTALSDRELLGRTEQLARGHARLTALLVAHLAELDARRLYLAEGFPSLYAYCIAALKLSEYAAYNRIEAARVARRFPIVLRLLASGDLRLSAIGILARHLTGENHEGLLASAVGKSKREVESLVAASASAVERPTPPILAAAGATASVPKAQRRGLVRIRVRIGKELRSIRAPGRPAGRASGAPGAEGTELTLFGPDGAAPIENARLPAPDGPQRDYNSLSSTRPPVAEAMEDPTEYRVTLTLDAAAWQELERARDLLRHKIPNGDYNRVVSLAVRELAARLAARKYGAPRKQHPPTHAPVDSIPSVLAKTRHEPTESKPARRSRHLPVNVRRAVWVRDQGRCAFVALSGHRCRERAWLEFHHRRPFRHGGAATVDNLELRCRAHNAHEESGAPSEWRRAP